MAHGWGLRGWKTRDHKILEQSEEENRETRQTCQCSPVGEESPLKRQFSMVWFHLQLAPVAKSNQLAWHLGMASCRLHDSIISTPQNQSFFFGCYFKGLESWLWMPEISWNKITMSNLSHLPFRSFSLHRLGLHAVNHRGMGAAEGWHQPPQRGATVRHSQWPHRDGGAGAVQSKPGGSMGDLQDPNMEVLYHIRLYFMGIFPEI